MFWNTFIPCNRLLQHHNLHNTNWELECDSSTKSVQCEEQEGRLNTTTSHIIQSVKWGCTSRYESWASFNLKSSLMVWSHPVVSLVVTLKPVCQMTLHTSFAFMASHMTSSQDNQHPKASGLHARQTADQAWLSEEDREGRQGLYVLPRKPSRNIAWFYSWKIKAAGKEMWQVGTNLEKEANKCSK